MASLTIKLKAVILIYAQAALLGQTCGHFFNDHGIQDLQDFLAEDRLETMFGRAQSAK